MSPRGITIIMIIKWLMSVLMTARTIEPNILTIDHYTDTDMTISCSSKLNLILPIESTVGGYPHSHVNINSLVMSRNVRERKLKRTHL